jgi:hypothetical protein
VPGGSFFLDGMIGGRSVLAPAYPGGARLVLAPASGVGGDRAVCTLGVLSLGACAASKV